MQTNKEVILIDSDADAGAEAGATRGDTQQIEGDRMAAEDKKGSKLLCSKAGCNKKAMKDGIGLCYVHGERKRCSYPGCNNVNRKGGLCVRHGSTKKTCTTPGCNKNAVKGGVCIAHDAKCPCMIVGCGRNLFKERKCWYHYTCSVGGSGSDWDPSITRVMGMVGCEVLACLGMTNWMMCLLFQGCVNHGGKHPLISSTG